MVIKIPQHRCFSNVFPEDIDDPPEWEIAVPQKDDTAWSIVLSFLLSAYNRDSENVACRVEPLTGNDRIDAKSTKKAIRFFNPFRNRYAIFYSETLKQVVSQFKSNLEWNRLKSVSQKLHAASKLLKCSILLICDVDGSVKTRTFLTNAEDTEETKLQEFITLISSRQVIDEDSLNSGVTVYNFLLHRDLSLKLKKAALRYFLRQTRLTREHIHQVLDVAEENKHFLISILKSNFRNAVSEIYKSPYIVSKIAEAGYKTDPRTTDEDGFSALYHALISEDTKILYELYYFSANSCCITEGSYRNPDSCIVSNLRGMETILLNDSSLAKSFSLSKNKDECKNSVDHLLKINKFLMKVSSKILTTKQKLNFYEKTPDDIFEATKRRDIIVSVLDSYTQLFEADVLEYPEFSPLDYFMEHKSLCYSVDVATVTSFLDNIIYLKECLSIKKNEFSKIESGFLFLISLNVIIDRSWFENVSKESLSNIQEIIKKFYAFPLIQRDYIIDKAKKFSKILQDTVIDENNVLKCIPKEEIYSSLNSYPVIKDYLQIKRLRDYLTASINVKIVDIKLVLIIERMLQILGEFINPEPFNEFSLRRILPLYFPQNIYHTLKRLRHEITYLKGNTFPAKFESEKNYPLFRSIQKEIHYIETYLQPIFRFQKMREFLYLIEQLVEIMKQLKSTKQSSRYGYEYMFQLDEELLRLRNKIPKKHLKPFIGCFLNIFKTVLTNLSSEFQNETDQKNITSLVENKLWSLKYLLEFSKRFPHYISNKGKSLLKLYKIIEECRSHDLKQNTEIFLKKCNDYISKIKFKDRKTPKTLENSNIFLKVLKGFNFLSDCDRNKIRNEIPLKIKESELRKERAINSIKKGFTLNVEEQNIELNIQYLSNTKLKLLLRFYQTKNEKALEILQATDPITELENSFSTNSLNKKKYETLCNEMEFSEETKQKLGQLVAGQRKKIPANNLKLLLNRIQLLREILIEENKEISELWNKIKSAKSRQYIVDRIIQRYLNEIELRASTEALLLDCMTLCENDTQNLWIKSSKFYGGIKLRNVIEHGNPLLESLCCLLDPDDLPTEIVHNMLRLIDGEEAVKALLELYQFAGYDVTKMNTIINKDDDNNHNDLRQRIVRCNDYKTYSQLLPRY